MLYSFILVLDPYMFFIPSVKRLILNHLFLVMKNKIQLLFILTVASYSLQAQLKDTSNYNEITVDRALRLLAGYSVGTYSYAEIGFAKTGIAETRHPTGFATFITTELKLGGKFVIGPKIGFWSSNGIMGIGMNMIYYTDFNNHNVVFRPEVGVGFDRFKIVYGYNANLSRNRLERINRNLFGVVYGFKLIQLKDK
jgi:hypothetical protein